MSPDNEMGLATGNMPPVFRDENNCYFNKMWS